jgi:hypothetical protein
VCSRNSELLDANPRTAYNVSATVLETRNFYDPPLWKPIVFPACFLLVSLQRKQRGGGRKASLVELVAGDTCLGAQASTLRNNGVSSIQAT